MKTVGIRTVFPASCDQSDMTSKVADNKKIGEIIGSIKVGMLTTVQANGELRSRPMLCADCDFDSLWFLVKESKPLIAEAIGNRVVNCCFRQPRKAGIRPCHRSRSARRRRKDDPKTVASRVEVLFPERLGRTRSRAAPG